MADVTYFLHMFIEEALRPGAADLFPYLSRCQNEVYRRGFWSVWRRFGGVMGRLKTSWGVLGVSWGCPGGILGASWGVLRRLGGVLDAF